MAKRTVDIEYVKEGLRGIGYSISDVVERDNNGINWQIKFDNSGAIITIYDTNAKKNTVVNGKTEDDEAVALKNIVDGLKCKELFLDEINELVVSLIDSHHEDTYYDYKRQWYADNKTDDFVHDILCLSNNIDNRDAYLIIGVDDQNNVVGVNDWKKSNEIFDLLGNLKFAGDNKPDIELKKIYYKYKKVDVLVCKKSNKVPFYLSEKYKGVFEHQIYTRFGDKNTPKTGHASYKDVELLWKIHFGI